MTLIILLAILYVAVVFGLLILGSFLSGDRIPEAVETTFLTIMLALSCLLWAQELMS